MEKVLKRIESFLSGNRRLLELKGTESVPL
jgi:hypothetical protein